MRRVKWRTVHGRYTEHGLELPPRALGPERPRIGPLRPGWVVRELEHPHGALPDNLAVEPLVDLDGFDEAGGDAMKVFNGLADIGRMPAGPLMA